MKHRIPFPGERWAIRLDLAKLQEKPLKISSEGVSVMLLRLEEGKLVCNFTANIKDNPAFPGKTQLEYRLEATILPSNVTVEWLGYSIRLYADGKLADEEWPIGNLAGGEWEIDCEDISALEFCQPNEAMAEKASGFTGPMQYFCCPGDNTGVGDCMPFSRNGLYCLYYLFDRRGHKSKAGMGAHQWAQISSSDLKNWTIHPMAVPVTEQWEGSICTGSLIQKDGLTYAFYAVRMSDGSPARMSWAVSSDGINFKKSGKYFALSEPYEPVSARDPMVFLGADGKYHMLVTTSLPKEGPYGGCLAHMVSDDLLDWQQLPPFIVPGYSDQPECSDYFEWNGWYYLVFANFATARYRMSRSPFGPWQKPKYDILDSMENQVAKTAAFGDRRLVTGFLARYPRTYAGNAVTHELVQQGDGTLGVRFVPEILPAFDRSINVPDTSVESQEGRKETVLAEDLNNGFRLRATLSIKTYAGLSIHLGKREHRLDFNSNAGMVSLMRPDPHVRFHLGDPRLQITGLDLSGPITIDLIVKDDIIDLALGDGKCLTARLSNSSTEGACLAAYAQCGALQILNINMEA